MGVIAIGGLVTSTLLTLVVVPIAYTLIDDAQTAVFRALRAGSPPQEALGGARSTKRTGGVAGCEEQDQRDE